MISPADGSHFFHYPRTTTLVWTPVSGATGYVLEREYQSGGVWHSDLYPDSTLAGADTTAYTFNFVGDQPGRWRVTAIGGGTFQDSSPSAWWTFDYETSNANRLATPTIVSPVDGSNFVHSPRTTTLVWTPVAGATGYLVECDLNVGGSWQTVFDETVIGMDRTAHSFTFSGDDQGRWRVTALCTDGTHQNSLPSAWSTFQFEDVNRPPIAALTATPDHGVAPLTVVFDASAASDPDQDSILYTWHFGDGTSDAMGLTTSHTYAKAGQYTATLTVTDPGGLSDTVATTISVDAPVHVQVVPPVLNIGNKGVFVAFVTLPSSYATSDVVVGSVRCEGAPALRLVRGKKVPRTFAAIFRRDELVNVKTGERVPMTVSGSLTRDGKTLGWSGTANVKIINKGSRTKETINDVIGMTDEKIFSQFFNP